MSGMSIDVYQLSDKGLVENDFRGVLVIQVDGQTVFEAFDGEPEDASLGRDFADAFQVPQLLQNAFNAGKLADAQDECQINDHRVDDVEDIPGMAI